VSQLSPFLRKIIYLVAIVALLIPMSLISRPAQRADNVEDSNSGGKLSQLRDEYSLSQAQLSDIDPASETMKLASLGLRGVAVNMLWLKAIEYKKTENYDQLAATLEALTKIQPSFIKVWEFQAHNLAYNVSMEFDDYEYRYHWVKKGLDFLKRGIPYNKTDHRMSDNLGFFTGNKFGKSDEKESFRRMFREDDEFHDQMSDMIDPDSYDTRTYGHDSWKMAYQWYDYSRDLVDSAIGPQRISDMMFFMYRPAQLRNQSLSLQEEFRSDEIIQENWRSANEEWLVYGQDKITNSLGVTITLEGMAEYEARLTKLQERLDELVPGERDRLLAELKALANLTPEEKYAMSLPVDQRSDEEARLAREANRRLYELDQDLDARIVSAASDENRLDAQRVLSDISQVERQMRTISKDSDVVNYVYWKARTLAESETPTLLAQQALYDAAEMRRRSIYDDEFQVDFKTGEKSVTRAGAISLYLDAFEQWSDVIERHPDLRIGVFADDLVEKMEELQDMLDITNREWPDDFPMQDFIDYRATQGEPDDLPTTDELEEERSGRADDSDEEVDSEEPDEANKENESVDSDDAADETDQSDENASVKSDENEKVEPEASSAEESSAAEEGVVSDEADAERSDSETTAAEETSRREQSVEAGQSDDSTGNAD
jgi:hypothetical protein